MYKHVQMVFAYAEIGVWQDKYLGCSWGVGLGRGLETGEKRKAFIVHLTCFVIKTFFTKSLWYFYH